MKKIDVRWIGIWILLVVLIVLSLGLTIYNNYINDKISSIEEKDDNVDFNSSGDLTKGIILVVITLVVLSGVVIWVFKRGFYERLLKTTTMPGSKPRPQVSKKERKSCSGDLEMVNRPELKKMVQKLEAEPQLEKVMKKRLDENPKAVPRRAEMCKAIHKKTRGWSAKRVLKILGPALGVALRAASPSMRTTGQECVANYPT